MYSGLCHHPSVKLSSAAIGINLRGRRSIRRRVSPNSVVPSQPSSRQLGQSFFSEANQDAFNKKHDDVTVLGTDIAAGVVAINGEIAS